LKVSFLSLLVIIAPTLLWAQSVSRRDIPKTWDETALSGWVTPVAGLNLPPSHVPEKDYYAFTVENLRTYPVYYPGREPDGYWEMLQHIGPKPLLEPMRLKTEADWIEAGRRVFDELDLIPLRTRDPKFIAAARNRETFDAARAQPLSDGTVFGARWVPTASGVALSFSNCSDCHLLHMRDGTRVPGAPAFAGEHTVLAGLVTAVQMANRVVPSAVPLRMGDEPFGMWLYRESKVPWRQDDVHEQLKTFTSEDFRAHSAARRGGAPLRWNGSLFYPAKAPDLIGIRGRKYLDATATHLHRGIGDLMRYAALVSYAEAVNFGPYHFLAPDAESLG